MPAHVSDKTTRVLITMNKNLKKAAEDRAALEQRSLANLISVALTEYLNSRKENGD